MKKRRPCHVDRPDAVFHLTARVNWRVWHLAPETAGTTFDRILDECAEEFGVNLIGDVLMSNHYHFVAQSPPLRLFRRLTGRRTNCRHLRPYPAGHPKASVLRQFMQKLMYRVSRAIQAQLGISGHFWEGPYHGRKLVDATDLVVALAYDHLNPVRQGMAASPELFPRSSAAFWRGTGDSTIALLRRRRLPFGLTREELACRLLTYETSQAFPEVMDEFLESGVAIETPEGQVLLRELLAARDLPIADGEVRKSLW